MIYFARAGDDGPVKIGWATDPKRRLGQLQAGCWVDVHLLRTINSTRHGELLVHAYFSGSHLRGEWFRYKEEMLTFSMKDIRRIVGPAMVHIRRISPSYRGRILKIIEAAA